MDQFVTVITSIGQAKIAAAIASGVPALITEAAAGDGGGSFYNPTPDQTGLRGETWRGNIVSAEIDGIEPNMINVRFIIPPEVGGFTVREAGLFDADGDMLAVCNLPDTRKEVFASGSIGKLTIIMHIVITDTGALEFTITPQLDGVTPEQLAAAVAAHNESPTAHSELWMAIDQVVSALPNDFYTRPQTDQRISDDINTHNVDPNAHGAIHIGLAGLDSRVTILELMMGGGISTNPFAVTFASLAGLTVEGVWNQSMGRIEF